MPIQDPSTIGVVGAGQMGRGIAQVAAQSGYTVLLHDQDVKVLDLALRSIDAGLKHQVEKGKLEESVRAQVIGRVRVAVEPEALSSADFTIEAISEDRALRRESSRRSTGSAGPTSSWQATRRPCRS